MQEFQRSLLLPYPVEEIFQIVNDVEKYSEYIPSVSRSNILSSEGNKQIVSMQLDAKGITETLVTSNTSFPSTGITISLVEGPFEHLTAHWAFNGLEDLGCRVGLTVEFELKGRLLKTLLAPLYERIVDRLMKAFHTRVQELLERE